MIRLGGRLSPEVRALLDKERSIPTQSAVVRARALHRAHAALAAKPVAAPASVGAPSRAGWAAAAVLLCVLGAAVGAAAYEIRAHLTPSPNDRSVRPTIAATLPRATSSSPAPSPHVPAPRLSKDDAAREELRLMRQARAAVAREDFADALRPLAEHGRRFKDGRLAEEREALRVKALAGLGRTDEARRAAGAFEARFPRSVLLPAVSQMPASGPSSQPGAP